MDQHIHLIFNIKHLINIRHLILNVRVNPFRSLNSFMKRCNDVKGALRCAKLARFLARGKESLMYARDTDSKALKSVCSHRTLISPYCSFVDFALSLTHKTSEVRFSRFGHESFYMI